MSTGSIILGTALGLFILLVIGLEFYWYYSNPWFWCRKCGRFWHLKTSEKRLNQPEECEGVCRERYCHLCNAALCDSRDNP
jgi:hypothetical protein